MSKRIIYFLTMVFSLSMLTFTACGDDDDDAVADDYVSQISGTYNGDLIIPDMISGKQDISIASSGTTNRAKISLSSLTIPTSETTSLVVTGIEIKSVPVSKTGDTYKIEKSTEKITIKINNLLEMEANVTVEGSVNNNKLDLKIDVKDIDIPDLAITFSGTKK
ncbi:hypothetical protein JGH11_02600 [Dysgonomonas sp. Marseille-P4677]|uniref:calycin-like domain-containing protein n=1 Tax=Dysgonomonas sp. Marseille-P4677 TaxID=2364790 RepID=UPI0019116459|nr:calycin-like domain-containing protein [Dysgonomonas sp. Marseille-P4677]MBK5719757.1 hypothetical protein [Dysgonomonas sp. Marseille-P4677]